MTEHETGVPARSVGTGVTKVVFIAGSGRSGSTLLGNALGSLPGAFSAGEIKLGFRRGLVEQGRCGCRELVRECPVWSRAFESAFGTIPTAREADKFDRSLAAAVRTRRVPWWLLNAQSSEVDELVAVMGRLIGAVASASGADVVVDSSKLPAYGALLARSPQLDVRVVHLIRDPRAVAWSWQRERATQQVSGFEEEMERFSPAKTSMMWLESGTTIPYLWRKDPANPLTLHYEDLVKDPVGELGRVAEHAGIEPDVSFVHGGSLHMRASHAVAGNPNRVCLGPVQLKRDDEWKSLMPPRDKALVSLVTMPRRLHYGY